MPVPSTTFHDCFFLTPHKSATLAPNSRSEGDRLSSGSVVSIQVRPQIKVRLCQSIWKYSHFAVAAALKKRFGWKMPLTGWLQQKGLCPRPALVSWSPCSSSFDAAIFYISIISLKTVLPRMMHRPGCFIKCFAPTLYEPCEGDMKLFSLKIWKEMWALMCWCWLLWHHLFGSASLVDKGVEKVQIKVLFPTTATLVLSTWNFIHT